MLKLVKSGKQFDTAVHAAAHAAHELNRVFCEFIGDPVSEPWDESPDWQKESVLNGVLAIVRNPGLTPSEGHQSWIDEKCKNGWVYGLEKDVEKKTHPCLVPYKELPAEQKLKDSLFGIIVRAVLNVSLEKVDT